ncbi:protein kinase domain-containing protein [Paraburkholderia tagetis]|uniref:non-specific serine/threonine protein kinase n=1 Tax=Paraburkholderia tagetis TaxID=2913261 RepID=A0A9X1RM11_9BURK|nr:protein kinase [Paraburkholderia tagetis]MCG5072644.1 protein kinase [Paraburkholderia tagetis]
MSSSPDDKTVIVSAPSGQDAPRADDATVIHDASTHAPPASEAATIEAATKAVEAAPAQTPPPPQATQASMQTQPVEASSKDSTASTNVASATGSTGSASSQPTANAATAPEAGHQALPINTRIAEFEIVGLIGEGGFGIVYLAWDTLLRRHVALKEYIPAALAARVAGSAEVTVRSQRHEDTFRAGLKSFINEAQLLAQFDHHSLVKVYRFWEANSTAYMVMPYYEGETLKETLRQLGTPPTEAWLRGLLAPLIDALAVLHDAQCFHRDIAPDNIMLLKGSQRPLLLDFGAARRVIGDMTQALTVILKPGYAPVEQYAEVPSMKQGPWTDIYALAAVVYYAIEGKTPPASVGRLMGDTYAPLATTAAGRYDDAFLHAIDHALAVRPEERPQDVRALAAELGIAAGGDAASGRAGAGLEFAQPYALREGETALPLPGSGVAAGSRGSGSVASVGSVASSAASAASAVPSAAAARSAAAGSAARSAQARAATAASITPTPTPTPAPAPAPAPAARKRAAPLAALGAGVAIVAAVGAWLALRPTGAPSLVTRHVDMPAPAHAPPSTTPVIASAATGLPPVPPPSTAASPGETTATASAATAAAPTASANTPPPAAAPASSAPSASLAPPLAPYTPANEFERIVTLADPSIDVHTTLRSTTARIKKDFLQFQVRSNRAGRVYAFMVDPQGNYLMLLPNGRDKANTIAAGQTLTLPRASWPMLADAPAGPIHFLVIVSPEPRDFSEAGLHPGDVFADFPARAQQTAAARRTANDSPFAGKARCAKSDAGATGCNSAFGAATFEIDVVGGSG